MGALDAAEHQRVSQALQDDAHLRKRLQTLIALPDSLGSEPPTYQPSGDLVNRVMAQVETSYPKAEDDGLSASANFNPSQTTSWDSFRMSTAAWFRSKSDGPDWLNAIFLGGCAMLAASLIGPAMVGWRESARMHQCASGLAELGLQLREYAFHNRERSLPSLDRAGPLSFAGVYAIRLHDAQYLENPRKLWCPGESKSRALTAAMATERLPTSEQFVALPPDRQHFWKHAAGGSYAYNIGMVIESEYASPKLDDQVNLAVLGDSPREVGGEWHFGVHRDGCNVLFAEGNVEWMQLEGESMLIDHPYFNRDDQVELGLDEEDCVLAPSFVTPFSEAR
jgi:hypothetical protein